MSFEVFESVHIKKPVNREILQGDVLHNLKSIPSNFFDTIITSPPYAGSVRDYDIEGQWGKEKDIEIYLDRLSYFMQQCKRILKSSGSLWINIGDFVDKDGSWAGVPEMFFVNCRKQNWKSISKIIWFKRNAMPLSTKKRFSPKYEVVYGFSKTDDYYFDLDSVRVPVLTEIKQKFNLRVREGKLGRLDKKYGNKYKATKEEVESHNNKGEKKQDLIKKGHYQGFNGRYDHNKVAEKGKNPGDVFDITVKSFKGSHFATFPLALPEVLIKASTPKNGWVLDPFFGSGTVGLVCEQLNLNWIGIELNPKYIELAKRRIFSNV